MADQRDITLRSLAGAPSDVVLYRLPVADPASTVIFLSAFDATPSHIVLRDMRTAPAGVSFPTQYSGFRLFDNGVASDLCLVALADAPSGPQLRLRKGSTTYAVYLVETTDGQASPVRVRLSTGTKAIRWKT